MSGPVQPLVRGPNHLNPYFSDKNEFDALLPAFVARAPLPDRMLEFQRGQKMSHAGMAGSHY